MLVGLVVEAPTQSFQIAQHLRTQPGSEAVAIEHAQQLVVVGVVGLQGSQEVAHAVGRHLPRRLLVEAFAGMCHRDVEQPVVLHVHRVAILHVEVVQHILRIHEAVALSRRIGEIGLGEVVFKSRQHMRDVVFVAAEVEAAHALQVALNLCESEPVGAEAHLGNVLKEREHGVGAVVAAQSVDPQQRAAGTVVGAQAHIRKCGVAVVAHQPGDVFAHDALVNMPGCIA